MRSIRMSNLICDLFYGKKFVLKQIIIKKEFSGQVERLVIIFEGKWKGGKNETND